MAVMNVNVHSRGFLVFNVSSGASNNFSCKQERKECARNRVTGKTGKISKDRISSHTSSIICSIADLLVAQKMQFRPANEIKP